MLAVRRFFAEIFPYRATLISMMFCRRFPLHPFAVSKDWRLCTGAADAVDVHLVGTDHKVNVGNALVSTMFE